VSAWLWARIHIAGAKALGIYGRDRDGHCFHVVVPLNGNPADEVIARTAADAAYRPRVRWRLGAHETLNNEKMPVAMVQINRMSFDQGSPDRAMVMLLTTAERRGYGLTEL